MAILKHLSRHVRSSLAPFRLGLIAFALGSVGVPVGFAADAVPSREYAIKAAALFNFVPFIQWPAEAFPDSDTPVVIGILGPDPFGPLIDSLVDHETFRGHPIQVERYDSLASIGRCHVLFVSRTALHDDGRNQLASLASRPILTVSDAAGFAQAGGAVEFYTDRNRLRMIVNLTAVRTAGLNISSKLLRLADVIKEDPAP